MHYDTFYAAQCVFSWWYLLHSDISRSIYAETFDVEAYCQYLAGLWHIFGAIEEQSLKAGEPVSQLDDVKLHRREVRPGKDVCHLSYVVTKWRGW